MDSETMRYVKKEVERQLNIILQGVTADAKGQTEGIDNLFPGMPTITERPVMHPYGLMSRAPDGTLNVVARQGADVSNRLVLGHRDKDAPIGETGETIVYSLGKYQVRIENKQVQLGKDGDFEAVPMGETMRQLLISMIQLIVAHTHQSNIPSAPTSVPLNQLQFTQLKLNYLDNKKILALDGGRF